MSRPMNLSNKAARRAIQRLYYQVKWEKDESLFLMFKLPEINLWWSVLMRSIDDIGRITRYGNVKIDVDPTIQFEKGDLNIVAEILGIEPSYMMKVLIQEGLLG